MAAQRMKDPRLYIPSRCESSPGRITYALALYTTAATNDHFAPRARAAIAKKKRQQARTIFAGVPHAVRLPLVVTFTRIAPRRLDSDNLPSAFKSERDGIADTFGVKDNDDAVIRWEYRQESVAPRTYGVVVDFVERR